jgi:hypothetical protein
MGNCPFGVAADFVIQIGMTLCRPSVCGNPRQWSTAIHKACNVSKCGLCEDTTKMSSQVWTQK